MNRQQLRPLGMGDIFDEGFDLYKRHFVFLLLVATLALAPLDTLLAFVTPLLLPPIRALLGASGGDAGGVWAVTALVRLVLFLPLYALAAAPLVAASAALYLGRDVTPASAYRLCLRRLPALLPAVLLTGGVLALSLLGCVVLWLPAAARLFFVLPVCLLEGLGPGRALGRSGRLAGGQGGRVFGALLLLGGVGGLIGLGIRLPLAYLFGTVLSLAPGGAAMPGGGSAAGQVTQTLSLGLSHLVLMPFLVCVGVVLYYDARVRKEAFDIELLAEGLRYPPLSALGPHLPPVAPPELVRLPAAPKPKKGRAWQ